MILEERLHLTVTEVPSFLLQLEHTTLGLREGDAHTATQTYPHRTVVQAVEGFHLIVTDKRCRVPW